MRLALDTNCYRAFMEKREREYHAVRNAEELYLPVPVIAELRYGFRCGTQSRQNEAGLVRFLDSPRVSVLPCDVQTTHFYAMLRLQLKKAGTPIPINDLWIAAVVMQHDLILLTSDRDFERIPQLSRF